MNVSQLRQEVTDLVTAVNEEHENTAEIQSRLDDCLCNIVDAEDKLGEIARLEDEQVEFEQKMLEHTKFQDQVLGQFWKMVNVLYDFLGPLINEEEQDNAAIAELRREMYGLEETVKTVFEIREKNQVHNVHPVQNLGCTAESLGARSLPLRHCGV